VYGREELDRLYRSMLVVVASLDDPGDPVPGDHCHFCPPSLICGAAKEAATRAMLTKVTQLPLGDKAAKLLDQIKRAQNAFQRNRNHYKRLLEARRDARSNPWLDAGTWRCRSREDTIALHGRTTASSLLIT